MTFGSLCTAFMLCCFSHATSSVSCDRQTDRVPTWTACFSAPRMYNKSHAHTEDRDLEAVCGFKRDKQLLTYKVIPIQMMRECEAIFLTRNKQLFTKVHTYIHTYIHTHTHWHRFFRILRRRGNTTGAKIHWTKIRAAAAVVASTEASTLLVVVAAAASTLLSTLVKSRRRCDDI